ncbi:MAG: hypothetical protein LBQ98_01930 [Nitrososphaerota archaeon]|jgi:endonuclease III|nr:hypothetical protein [Nitrososphaerota archaeon]
MLRDTLPIPPVKNSTNPHQTLVTPIISQTTPATNTQHAFKRPFDKFPITPKILATTKITAISECIQIAKLYQTKPKTIYTALKTILTQLDRTPPILFSPQAAVRQALISIRVGPKATDGALLFFANKPPTPVSKHIKPVSEQLKITVTNDGYKTTPQSLQSFIKPQNYSLVNLRLIAHSQKTCKTHNPLCTKYLNTYYASNWRIN